MRIKLAILGAAAGLALAAPAAAQLPGDQVVAASGGYLRFADAAAIQGTFAAAVDVDFRVGERLTLGPSLFVARGPVDPDRFPAVVMPFGPDSTDTFEWSPDVTAVGYGAVARLTFGGASFSPYVQIGGGGYALFLDAAQHGRNEVMTGLRAEGGAGVRIAVGETLGLQLEARDQIFLDYDQARLFPVEERYWSPDGAADPVEPSSTVHNLMFNIGFTYVPGGR